MIGVIDTPDYRDTVDQQIQSGGVHVVTVVVELAAGCSDGRSPSRAITTGHILGICNHTGRTERQCDGSTDRQSVHTKFVKDGLECCRHIGLQVECF